MNKKYLNIRSIFSFSLFICLICYIYFLRPISLVSCAWAEGSIITTEKGKKLVEIAAIQKIPDEELNQILGVIQKAGDERFPTEPFLNKALEGMSKRVSPTLILKALKDRLEHFRTCQRLLQSMPESEKEPESQKQQVLTIITESIIRGANEKELEELAGLAPTPRSINLANASEDLATFKNHGFSSADAMEIVKAGLKNGIYEERSSETAAIIQEANQKGFSVDELKGIFLSNIQKGNRMIRRGMVYPKPGQGNSSRQQPQVRGNNFRGSPSSR
ncbi:hypothetical protein JXL19_09415 [bacterium]|nr:hypothetical protein [bacterium]